jgi:predicted DsbA family dithiol-disulfide isomerase
MSADNKLVISIAHDYLCPWCWVGFFQAQKLKQEFPEFALDWRGFELLPEELGPIPEYAPKPKDPNQPPSRFELFAEAEGVPLYARTIGAVRTHSALEGAEYVKDKAPEKFDAYNEAVYRGYWERSEDISNLDVLGQIAAAIGLDREDFLRAVENKAYYGRIVRFDDDAYALDVTHVPTFMFRGERCAEAPYSTIRDLAQRCIIWYGKKED